MLWNQHLTTKLQTDLWQSRNCNHIQFKKKIKIQKCMNEEVHEDISDCSKISQKPLYIEKKKILYSSYSIPCRNGREPWSLRYCQYHGSPGLVYTNWCSAWVLPSCYRSGLGLYRAEAVSSGAFLPPPHLLGGLCLACKLPINKCNIHEHHLHHQTANLTM